MKVNKIVIDKEEYQLMDGALAKKYLDALKIIKKYIEIENYENDYAELIPYCFKDNQYVSLRSCKVMSKEEYELLKEVLELC